MNCYNHKDRPAVALCKQCYKGLCEECAIPDDKGFSCSEKCHQEVLANQFVIDNSKSLVGLKKGGSLIELLLFGMGSISLLWVIYQLLAGWGLDIFSIAVGILALTVGFISKRRSKKKN